MSDEPELRRDPVTGRWVLIAPDRARRPIAYTDDPPRHRTAGGGRPCPFCAGAEAQTPNEVYAVRAPGTVPNGPGWQLRVVPNMFPAVRPNAATAPCRLAGDAGGGPRASHAAPGEFPLFNAAPATGFAEVLIDCPEHVDDPAELSDGRFADVLIAYRERMRALARDPRLAHVAVFKNVGAEAGASLAHSHSQMIATPVVPDLVRAELGGAEGHFARSGRCVFCDIVEQELAERVRVVSQSESFVAVAAFAPRFAYEVWVLPVAHEARYEALTDARASELAALVKRVLRALDAVQ
ncbi:MAG: galactose-1-phosphate uridylyltransferase, partial [Gemmata sp.]